MWRVSTSRQLHAHRLDERGQRRGLLTPAWIVEEEAGERRAPILQDTHKRWPMIPRYSNRDHVPLDELPELDAGVEPGRDEILSPVVNRDVEHDVRIRVRELSQLRREHHRRSNPRHA